jgi:hypothetical protein
MLLLLLLALLVAVCAQEPALPQQRWTNYGAGAGGELAISWASSTTTDRVGYRLAPFSEPAAYTFAGAPELASYSAPPVGSRPQYTSLVMHRTYLSDLPPATRLRYVIAVDPADGATFSAEAELWTHPGVGADVPATLMVLADLSERPTVVAALSDRAANRSARATAGGIILGDLSYANGDNNVWDTWQNYFDPVASQLPIMVNAGNHELTNEPGFVAFKTRFGAMPYTPAFEDSANLFYSFEVGAMHVIVLSSFSDFSASSVQTFFLESDLKKVNRTRTPWLFVAFHAPLYNSNTNHYLQKEAMREAYEPTLLAYRVNAVLVGHVHAFQRTKLIAAHGLVVDEASGQGILHWMVGMSGKALYPKWRPEAFPEPQPVGAPPNNWVAARDATFYGFSSIEVPNATHACFRVFCTERDPVGSPGDCSPDAPLDEYWLANQLQFNPLPSAAPAPSASQTASASPTISASPSASVSVGSTPSTTPSATGTASVSATPTGSVGAAANVPAGAALPPTSPLTFGDALGTGVGVGLALSAATAALVAYVSSLRRRLVRDKISGSVVVGGVTEFGISVRKPGV